MPEETPSSWPAICYSVNDEDYNYTDLFSVMDELDSLGLLYEGSPYFEHDCQLIQWAAMFDVDYILESADERVYDIVGEVYDNELSHMGDEAKRELREFLGVWTAKHMGTQASNYWQLIGKARERQLTAAEVCAWRDAHPLTASQPL